CHIEQVTGVEHFTSGGTRFFRSFRTEVDVSPACEAVLPVPGTFPMPQQYECLHRDSPLPIRSESCFFVNRRPDLAAWQPKNPAWGLCGLFTQRICIWIVHFEVLAMQRRRSGTGCNR